MMPVFEVPAHRLVDLSDGDLRELVALLCEAERERQGGHRNDVHWGGTQTTPDGGLDVVVEAIGPFNPIGYLQRMKAGIQVKKGGMDGAEIIKEMRPSGQLRKAISDLAAASGSYLIVSAAANCAKTTMIASREADMRKAVQDDPNSAKLHLAFLDRNALARWASAHPSVVTWLRVRLGMPSLRGWKPYEQWSSTPKNTEDGLIVEEGLVFKFPDHTEIRNIQDGLQAVRGLVRKGEKAVRIAGLSGIGKSRIVQALFEDAPKGACLPRSYAIYSDAGEKQDPSPSEMLRELIQRGEPAILVVDNCPPETHTALAQELAKNRGPVRLITVEYDVQTDRPMETDVVKIEAKGTGILKALLQRRHPNLGEIDASRLADLAHGNARLGLALADAAPQTGSLSSFDDTVLFQRLFLQRSPADAGLEQSAEVLSLVYSFDKEGKEKPDELALLASIIGVTRNTLYRHTGVLQQRGLAQARGRWRAVLPHALANRLAAKCLSLLPPEDIVKAFSASPRMVRSLARRLSYLHDSEEAKVIVAAWMEPGGPLFGATADEDLLEIVCHLAPAETLKVIDEKMKISGADVGDPMRADPITRMLARIAYHEAHFAPVCDRLVAMALSFPNCRNHSEGALKSLFQLLLSGTTAKTKARVEVASRFLGDPDDPKRMLATTMVRSALNTGHFSSFGHIYDDARPAPYGWMPKGGESAEWFRAWFDLAVTATLQGHPSVRAELRQIIAAAAARLWRKVPAIRDNVISAVRQLHNADAFYEARAAILAEMSLWRRRKDNLPEADLKSLQNLVDEMQPADLAGRARQEIVRGGRHDIDYDHDDHTAAMALKGQQMVNLGRELGANPAVLSEVCSELMQSEGYQIHLMGSGLAEGTTDPHGVWHVLSEGYVGLGVRARQAGVFASFLHRLDKDSPVISEHLRTKALETPALKQIYGMLLPAGPLSDEEFERVVTLASDPDSGLWHYSWLLSDTDRNLSDSDRVRLLKSMCERLDGQNWVLHGLYHLALRDEQRLWSEELIDVAVRVVAERIKSVDIGDNDEHELARVAAKCLTSGSATAHQSILDAVAHRAGLHHGSIFGVRRVVQAVAELAPKAFLDWLEEKGTVQRRLDLHDSDEPSPVAAVPQDVLLEWCGRDPNRWAIAASVIQPFPYQRENQQERATLTPTAKALLGAAPDVDMVLRIFVEKVFPMSFSGSQASIMRHRLEALLALKDHPNETVRTTVQRLAGPLRTEIQERVQQEAQWDAERDQRFER